MNNHGTIMNNHGAIMNNHGAIHETIMVQSSLVPRPENEARYNHGTIMGQSWDNHGTVMGQS